MAGSRRDREDAAAPAPATPDRPAPGPRPSGTGASARRERRAGTGTVPARAERAARDARPARAETVPARRGRRVGLVAVLSVLCLLAAVAAGLLLWQRPDRTYVDPEIFTAAEDSVEAVYRYDYEDSDGSVAGQLDVLTGDLRSQYEAEAQGALIDTYEQVSATIRYDVRDVAVQQVDEEQDEATLVVFGQLVAKSVNTGTQPAPEGSECVVTADGEQSCVRTVQIRLVHEDDAWKISELTVLTTG
ncbi:hypothetical protein [Blastococcus sp. URHD0036]|uniref:hypothetical protein n=1 Tax=Blastococcus sp. URHD0036 TaxID=1380356 RepID=UPI000496DD4F|nr:hypothetical protein [Blastococcus sp. URHD0036]